MPFFHENRSNAMFQWVYTRSWTDILCMIAGCILLWAYLRTVCREILWKAVNSVFWVVWLAAVLIVTVASRTPDPVKHVPSLIPFSQLYRFFNGANPEIMRTAAMNVLLFIPHGIFASQLYTQRHALAVVVSAGLFISTGIEILQGIGMLGLAETDDVIANTLGSLAGGSIGVWIQRNIHPTENHM